MKILHIITSLRTGGAERLMLDLIPRLRKGGDEVELLVMDGTRTPFFEEALKLGIKMHVLEVGGKIYSLGKLWKMIPWLRCFDIVHTHNTPAQLFAAIGSVLCSVVLCTTEHNTSNRRRGSRWYALIDRWMYSRYKKVICISEGTENQLRLHLRDKSDKIVTIFNGIDIAKYRDASSKRLSTVEDQVTLIQVAGFRYQKDQDTVIRALSHLPEKFHLILVGDGERRSELESLVNSLELENRVHFLGVRSDISNLLKGADLAIMSSHWEGFGLAAAEAMAAGLPVLASDVDGLREVVKGAGILFPKGNDQKLADEILELTEDETYCKKIAQACSKRATIFDISTMASGYSSIYNDIKSNKINI